MDRGAWWATLSPWGRKESDTVSIHGDIFVVTAREGCCWWLVNRAKDAAQHLTICTGQDPLKKVSLFCRYQG